MARFVVTFVVAVVVTVPGVPSRGAVRYTDPVFEVAVTHDIAFGEAMSRRGELETLQLDLYEPVDDASPARPVFVFAHGGSLIGGDKGRGSGDPVHLATEMARRGYLAASINYRLLEQFVEGPLFVGAVNPELREGLRDAKHDMQAAVRWFRRHADDLRADPDRIAVSGHSAGAGIALLVNYDADDPGGSGNPGYPSHVSAVISHAGSLFDPTPVGMGEPPALDIHAIDDNTVPLAHMLATTYLPAVALGNSFELTLYTSGGHGLSGHLAERVGAQVSFLCSVMVECS